MRFFADAQNDNASKFQFIGLPILLPEKVTKF